MPNHKTDINNNGGFSTDFIGANYAYPEADYATRERIVARARATTRGASLPSWQPARACRKTSAPRCSAGVLARTSFDDTGGWPHQLYVREARRMISRLRDDRAQLPRRASGDDSVGLGAYNMDSHNCQRIVDERPRRERRRRAGAADEAVSDLVSRASSRSAASARICSCRCACRATHIAYGSIRMEPVFMILGQSAATAAALAIDDDVPVQKVDYAKLRQRLLADNQVLAWAPLLKIK